MKTLVKAIAGSHLFGTNTPSSDHDFKGVYLPELKQVVNKKDKDVIYVKTNNSNTKNESTDVDQEYFSIRKFFTMLQEGQTVAIELLYTPEKLQLETTDIFKQIQSDKKLFIHKGVSAYIGYARQQANRYGIRGSRMGALKEAIELLEAYPNWFKIGDIVSPFDSSLPRLMQRHPEAIRFTPCSQGLPHLEVCSRKLPFTASISYCIDNTLQPLYNEYGERSKLAMQNEGIDWKALSHAVRVINQGIELLETHNLVLPRPDAPLLLSIKQGKRTFQDVSELIESGFTELLKAQEGSTLPDKLSVDFIDDYIYDIYRSQL